MKINDWPIAEQPRGKLLRFGRAALSDAELLAILLRTGIPGMSVLDLARSLLKNFGSLRKIFAADKESFCCLAGLGEAKYLHLQAALELSQRLLYEEVHQQSSLDNPMQVRCYLLSKLSECVRETFACLYLNSQYQVIAYEELFHGSLREAEVYPREVAKQVLMYNAAAVIIAHNHPSGDIKPSEADIRITLHLKEALALIDVLLLDHIIVGINETCSLIELGLL